MPALSIPITPRLVATDLEHAVIAAELDWLEDALRDARSPDFLSSPETVLEAWLRLERLALSLGMPEGQGDGVVAWAEDYLRQHGRNVPQPAALTVGTAEYRQRHIAMLWQGQLWHEAVQVVFVTVTLGLLFYAVAAGAN